MTDMLLKSDAESGGQGKGSGPYGATVNFRSLRTERLSEISSGTTYLPATPHTQFKGIGNEGLRWQVPCLLMPQWVSPHK